MPVRPPVSYPGVYVQEVPSGVRTIVGVSTSTALFIGQAAQGPMFEPVLCLGYPDFERVFSGELLDPAGSFNELPLQVQQFFANGGTRAYVMRIGELSTPVTYASLTLKAEDGSTDVLEVTSLLPGPAGNLVRASVSYPSESTFNLTLTLLASATNRQAVVTEEYLNLSMDPASPRYVELVINSASALANVAVATGLSVGHGLSATGDFVSFSYGASDAPTGLAVVLGGIFQDKSVQVVFDGNPVNVTFSDSSYWADYVALNENIVTGGSAISPLTFVTTIKPANPPNDIFIHEHLEQEIISAYTTAYGAAPPTFTVSFNFVADGKGTPNSGGLQLVVTSTSNGRVELVPTAVDPIGFAAIGAAGGGVEVGPYAAIRPALSGFFMRIPGVSDPTEYYTDLMELPSDTAFQIRLTGTDGTAKTVTYTPVGGTANKRVWEIMTGRAFLAGLKAAVDSYKNLNPGQMNWSTWMASLSPRLQFLNPQFPDNQLDPAWTAGTTGALAATFGSNTPLYPIGNQATPASVFFVNGLPASTLDPPTYTDYVNALQKAEDDIDLFNLLLLPSIPGTLAAGVRAAASATCGRKRAFLVLDPPSSWGDVQTVASDVGVFRQGMNLTHSAVYWPNVKVQVGNFERTIGPSGSIAGVMARIDATRGVWKAPAGTEANLFGALGASLPMSDRQNGIINPRGVNAIRIFPNGIVSWGARTLDGDDDFTSEWKYVPVRRTALFIEESLYRGLKWAVFEPNDEPLWAQIRLNVGAFMQDLFLQGAFQGRTAKDAYFVKCDSQTTTQNDINLGVVNIWVGFAPLKPAEFVILYLQQMAGQVQA